MANPSAATTLFSQISHDLNIADTICNLLYAAFGDGERVEFTSLANNSSTSKNSVTARAISMILSDDYLLVPKELPAPPERDQSLFVTRYRPSGDISNPSKRVFISYRRADASPAASRLFCELTGTFGERNVFYDISSMPLGISFRRALQEAISEAEIFLLVIGPNWLSPDPASGKSRQFDPLDPVRLEIESALSCDAPIVPVLIDNASNPFVADLPPSIQAICDLDFMSIGSPDQFGGDFDLLINRCQTLARNDGLRNTLPMPELDGDALISIRMLAVACIYFRNLAHRLIEDKAAGPGILKTETKVIREVDGLLQRWGRAIGEKIEDEGNGTRLYEIVEQVLDTTYGDLDDDGWARLSNSIVGGDNIPLSKEQMVALAITGMINQRFMVNKRSARSSSARDDFFTNLEAMIRAEQCPDDANSDPYL